MSTNSETADRPDGKPEAADLDPQTMPLGDLRGLIKQVEEQGVTQSAEPETPTEPEVEPEPEPSEPETQQTEPEAEPDLKETRYRLELERRDAEIQGLKEGYEKLQKHAGRLAGEIGHLRKRSTEEYVEPATDDGREEYSPIRSIQARFDELERKINSEAVSRAIVEEIQGTSQRPEIQALKLDEELKEVAPKYQEQWSRLATLDDPVQARIQAKSLALGLLTDAVQARLAKAAATKATSESKSAATQTKKVAAAVSSGRPVGSRMKPPDPKTMPLGDLKKLIDRLGTGE